MLDPITRIPFFMFQDREAGIDADASKEKGYEVPRIVTFILVTPHGHHGDPPYQLCASPSARSSGVGHLAHVDLQPDIAHLKRAGICGDWAGLFIYGCDDGHGDDCADGCGGHLCFGSGWWD